MLRQHRFDATMQRSEHAAYFGSKNCKKFATSATTYLHELNRRKDAKEGTIGIDCVAIISLGRLRSEQRRYRWRLARYSLRRYAQTPPHNPNRQSRQWLARQILQHRAEPRLGRRRSA